MEKWYTPASATPPPPGQSHPLHSPPSGGGGGFTRPKSPRHHRQTIFPPVTIQRQL